MGKRRGLRPDLAGKKLLILAGSIHECDLVRRARELGVHTIVTDYYDVETSPAKKLADEYWNISWEDLDALEAKCKEEHVDGVTAGYSETTVDRCIKLCGRLGLPCYCTQEQSDVLKDKKSFKALCRRNGVPVVREYSAINEVESFPVIVKPVDRGGSIGVGIATDREALRAAYDYAMEKSYSKEVIIEDYIADGTKFDVYYAITDGEITFLSSSDTVNAADNGFERVVQSGWLLPSKYQDEYIQQADSAVREMIRDLGISNGFLFLSGFRTKGEFVFFETGFRLSGGHMYRYFEANGLPDVQDVFIQHALTGNSQGICFDKASKLKALIINFYAKKGILTEENGWDEISQIDACGFALRMSRMGAECHDDRAILTKLGMVHLYSESSESLLHDLERVNELYSARDQHGMDMVYDRMTRETVSGMMGE